MDRPGTTNLNKFLNPFSAGLVFMALVINTAAAWRSHKPAPPPERAAGYTAYARAYGRFTEPIGVREPVPVSAVKALGLIGFPPAVGAKTAGTVAFAALLWLTFLTLKRRYGHEAAAVGGLFLAANPYFSWYAMRGPAEIFPILFFLAFRELSDRGGGAARNLVLTALCGALAALSKFVFLAFVLYALAAGALKDRSSPRLKFSLRAAALCLALVSPYLIWQAAACSGPLSLQENTLRHWRNMELRGPALEMPFEGGPLEPAAFVFADGPARAAARFGAGLKKVFLAGLPRLAYYYRFELFLGLAGCVLLFMKREWPFASLFFVFILPVAFIAGIDQVPVYGGIEPRFYLPAFWLICCYAGYGCRELILLFVDQIGAWAAGAEKAAKR